MTSLLKICVFFIFEAVWDPPKLHKNLKIGGLRVGGVHPPPKKKIFKGL